MIPRLDFTPDFAPCGISQATADACPCLDAECELPNGPPARASRPGVPRTSFKIVASAVPTHTSPLQLSQEKALHEKKGIDVGAARKTTEGAPQTAAGGAPKAQPPPTIADLEHLVAGVGSNDRTQQREATVGLRKLLSIGKQPPHHSNEP